MALHTTLRKQKFNHDLNDYASKLHGDIYYQQPTWMKFVNNTGKILFVPNVWVSPEMTSMIRMKRKLLYSLDYIRWYSFCTLTYAEDKLPTKWGGYIMRQFLNKLAMSRKKNKEYLAYDTKIGSKISYMWKFELGEKSGRPHFHIMFDRYHAVGYEKFEYADNFGGIRSFKKSKNYKGSLAQLWGNGGVLIEKIDSKSKATSYISKYLTKSVELFETVKEMEKIFEGRRWSCSRNIKKKPSQGFKLHGLVNEGEKHELELYEQGVY